MIHVCFGIDDRYLDKPIVVMRSIIANTKEDVQFHVLGSKVLSKEFNIINHGEPDTSILYGTKPNPHLSLAACNRLFIPTTLTDIDKVVYLDVDVVVLGDIAELFKYKVDYIAGVKDPMYIHNAKKNGLTHSYINSGVMIMNLKALREMNFIQACVDIQDKGYNFSLLDQDIINVVLNKKLQHLPKEWNVYGHDYPEMTEDMFEARKHPKIIHFCGIRKPWNSDVWGAEEYRKYLTK